MSYRVEMTRRAKKAADRLPGRQAERVYDAIDLLADEPFPRGALKLEGAKPPLWRIRVGEYRVVYSVSDELQLVIIEQVTRRTTTNYERLP